MVNKLFIFREKILIESGMSAPKKGTQKFQIQLEASFIEELRRLAEAEGEPSANALAARIIRENLKNRRAGKTEGIETKSQSASEIDLRSLLIEAHRNISELTRTITALTEERKNAPAEPAAVVESTGSTASPAQRGRARVVTGLRQGSAV